MKVGDVLLASASTAYMPSMHDALACRLQHRFRRWSQVRGDGDIGNMLRL
jgi:hypothetical protein